MNDGAVVKFNVGGTVYATTASTLHSRGENMLTKMLSTDVALVREGGAIFIDRSGRLFEFVLEFLRTGKTGMVKPAYRNAFEDELRYYNVAGSAGEVSDASLRQTIRNALEGSIAKVFETYEVQAEFLVKHVLLDLQSRAEEGTLRPGALCSVSFVAEILDQREDVSKKFLRAMLADTSSDSDVVCVMGIDTQVLEQLAVAVVNHFLTDYRLTMVYTLERRLLRFKWLPSSN